MWENICRAEERLVPALRQGGSIRGWSCAGAGTGSRGKPRSFSRPGAGTGWRLKGQYAQPVRALVVHRVGERRCGHWSYLPQGERYSGRYAVREQHGLAAAARRDPGSTPTRKTSSGNAAQAALARPGECPLSRCEQKTYGVRSRPGASAALLFCRRRRDGFKGNLTGGNLLLRAAVSGLSVVPYSRVWTVSRQ